MTFNPKGESVIRQEVIEDLKGGQDDFNADEHKETIDRVTQRRLKDEQMKASLHKQKTDKEERKEFYKKIAVDNKLVGADGKPVQKDNPPAKPPVGTGEAQVSQVDMAQFFAKGGSQTEYRYAIKVMKATDKDFRSALDDGLYKAWKKENDKMLQSRKAQLGPSRGGSHKAEETEDDKIAAKFASKLPAGFSAKPKSK